MTSYYAGIGSRTTPADVLKTMQHLASTMEIGGYILRSGGANGADSAFESGLKDPRNAHIFLPWKNFNNNPSHRYEIRADAFAMAKHYHPNWKACSEATRKFHARNCYQVLGFDLQTPVEFVICWTPNGKATGGTGQALRIAQSLDIPIYNLGDNS